MSATHKLYSDMLARNGVSDEPDRDLVPRPDFDALGTVETDEKFLVVYSEPEGAHWRHVLIAEWAQGPSTDARGVVVEPEKYEPRVRIEGAEWDGARHLYFSEDGYVYYPDAELFTKIAEVLERFFPKAKTI